MTDRHPSQGDLQRLRVGRGTSPGERGILAHVERCRVCQNRLQRAGTGTGRSAVLSSRSQPWATSPFAAASSSAYEEAFSRAVQRVQEESWALAASRSAAEGPFAELKRLSFEQQRFLLKNTSRFLSWGLVELMLVESRACWAGDPARAEHWCRLAIEIAELLDLGTLHRVMRIDLKGRAWAYLGNALRIQSRLAEAQQALVQAEALLEQGSGDPLELGHFLDLKASLFLAQSRLEEAEGLLGRAVAIYARAAEHELIGRAMIKQAMICRERGELDQGIAILHRAEELLGTDCEPRVLLCIRHNLTLQLFESGRIEAAERLFPQVRKLALELGSQLDLVRLRWVCGVAALAKGLVDRAETYLTEARNGFLQANLTIEVAQVSLDLAGLYLDQGRFTETQELVTQVLPVFDTLGIQRDALATLLLFVQAAERQAATVAALREAAALLKRAANVAAREQ